MSSGVEPIPFEPWYESPRRLASLYLWLRLMDEEPTDVPRFLLSAQEDYAVQYAEMLSWDKNR